MDICVLLSAVCCQVKVSATGPIPRPKKSHRLCACVTLSVVRCSTNSLDLQWVGRRDQTEESIHPTPKNSECKIRLDKFSSRFFEIKTTSSSLIVFQRAKLSTRSITHLYCCSWRTFWRKKKPAGRSPKVSCSCMAMPRLTGHLQPRRNWPTRASSILITHPILRIWPRRTTTCSLDWKNNWKVAIFHPKRRSLLPRRPGWTDNILNFFWVACKS